MREPFNRRVDDMLYCAIRAHEDHRACHAPHFPRRRRMGPEGEGRGEQSDHRACLALSSVRPQSMLDRAGRRAVRRSRFLNLRKRRRRVAERSPRSTTSARRKRRCFHLSLSPLGNIHIEPGRRHSRSKILHGALRRRHRQNADLIAPSVAVQSLLVSGLSLRKRQHCSRAKYFGHRGDRPSRCRGERRVPASPPSRSRAKAGAQAGPQVSDPAAGRSRAPTRAHATPAQGGAPAAAMSPPQRRR